MKKIVKLLLMIFIAVSISISQSCTRDFNEINTNPYLPTEEDMGGDNFISGAFFPQMQKLVIPIQENAFQHCESMIGDVYGGYLSITSTTGGWSQNFSNYNPKDSWIDEPFKVIFSGTYGAYNEICKRTKREGVNYAWAKLLRVAIMHRMADLYGPIPYSKVGLGGLKTAYDSQEDVYNAMFIDLDSAIEVLTGYVGRNPGQTPMKDYDEVYDGDFSKWVKFANSLKLRLAMRIVYVNPALAQAKGEEAISHPLGVITSNSDNASIRCDKNPLNVMAEAYGDSRAGADLISHLQGYNDPRIGKYFQKGTNGTTSDYYGLRSGVAITNKDAVLPTSKPYATPTDRVMWLNAAEVAFLKAEGSLRGWATGGSAENLYNEGIKLSFEQWGAGDPTTYLADATLTPASFVDPFLNKGHGANSTVTIAWDAAATPEVSLERLITQKWIAMFPLGQEAWSDFRRTGYPNLFRYEVNNSGGSVNTADMARRIPFPPNEYIENSSNVSQAVGLLGGPDQGKTKLWWDKK